MQIVLEHSTRTRVLPDVVLSELAIVRRLVNPKSSDTRDVALQACILP